MQGNMAFEDEARSACTTSLNVVGRKNGDTVCTWFFRARRDTGIEVRDEVVTNSLRLCGVPAERLSHALAVYLEGERRGRHCSVIGS